MANPQCEEGYLKIAMKLVEALASIRISGQEYQCLWFIFRKTYGWSKKEDRIPLSQFMKATGIKKSSVSRALRNLAFKKMITIITNDDSFHKTYRFNKDFDEWIPLTKKLTVLTKK